MRIATISMMLAGFCAALAGCAADPADKPAAEAPAPVATALEDTPPPAVKSVTVKDDEFDKTILFIGPEEEHEPALTSRKPNVFQLKTTMDRKSGEVTHQLVMTHNYAAKSWKFWQRAADEDAEPLELATIRRDVGFCSPACTYAEVVGATLSDAALRARKDKGYSIKLYARDGGEKVIALSPEMIAMQIAAIDQRKPPAPAPAAEAEKKGGKAKK